jgi:hypothetical protein
MAKSKSGAQQNVRIIRALLEARVECVVVGGVAAMMHGASRATEDIDFVAPLTVENCIRILSALHPFHLKFYQTLGHPPVLRTAAELAQFRNLYFDSELGIVDLLGELPPIGTYERVASSALPVDVGLDIPLQLISLDDLIAVKEFVARPKDVAVAAELKAIRNRLRP